jgi:hypothetical protein
MEGPLARNEDRRRGPVSTRPIRRLGTIGAIAAAIFAVVSLGLLCLHGNRLIFHVDEGSLLDAAERMLHGQTVYRDFFVYIAPGSLWMQEAAFRLFGLSMWAGRVVAICDLAVECALVFWLTARLAGKRVGLATATLFFAFQAAMPELLAAQHRIDGAALSLASIALCVAGQQRRKMGYWAGAGVLAAWAAACTPPLALLALPAMVWLLASRPLRRFSIPYVCGASACSASIAAALAAQGALLPFIGQMIWLRHNYAGMAAMPYGAVIGGYRAALGASVAGGGGVTGALALFCFALPAVLPPVALAAWSLTLLRSRDERRRAADGAIPYLLACMAMEVVSAYPRADLLHLAFVAALPAVLTAVWIARYAPGWLVPVFAVPAACALVFLAEAASPLGSEVAAVSPVGTLRVSASDAPAVAALLKTVHPGDSLYVHPYMPMLYFLTQARNPTRYSHIVPGLMTHADETAVLDDLERSPPRWVLYFPIGRAGFLQTFPSATNLDHRFPTIEAWRLREYAPVEPPVDVRGYRLYERRTVPAASPGGGLGNRAGRAGN